MIHRAPLPSQACHWRRQGTGFSIMNPSGDVLRKPFFTFHFSKKSHNIGKWFIFSATPVGGGARSHTYGSHPVPSRSGAKHRPCPHASVWSAVSHPVTLSHHMGATATPPPTPACFPWSCKEFISAFPPSRGCEEWVSPEPERAGRRSTASGSPPPCPVALVPETGAGKGLWLRQC